MPDWVNLPFAFAGVLAYCLSSFGMVLGAYLDADFDGWHLALLDTYQCRQSS